MTSEQTPVQGGGEAQAQPTSETGRREQMLAAQHERLAQLRLRSDELHALRDRECELEVELIAAEAAHKAPFPGDKPGLDATKAGAIAEALARTSDLRGGLREDPGQQSSPAGAVSTRELARLKAAQEALSAWLEAPGEVKRRELPPLAQAMLGLALLACVWAGFTFHLAFLLLLIPLGLPFSFLALGAHDLSWVRLGTRRRFEATDLEPPTAWKTPAVTARRSEIERAIKLAAEQPARETAPQETQARDRTSKETELYQTETHLQTLMYEAGLDADSMSGELARWLKLEGEVRCTRRELRTLQAKRRAIGAETDAGREELFRFLSRQGEAPPEGRADLDALAAGLERVRHKLADADSV